MDVNIVNHQYPSIMKKEYYHSRNGRNYVITNAMSMLALLGYRAELSNYVYEVGYILWNCTRCWSRSQQWWHVAVSEDRHFKFLSGYSSLQTLMNLPSI